MISEQLVDASRLQFAVTALYHFLFVPLTLGMAFLLAIMETVYVLSGKQMRQSLMKRKRPMGQEAGPQGGKDKWLEHQPDLIEQEDQKRKEHHGKDLLS